MADCIKLLPEIVANQIKAGEVVESPSSVVKDEFLPHNSQEMDAFLEYMKGNGVKITKAELQARIDSLSENNPMLGHRGCRIAVSYPEIYEMQVSAIFEAACKLRKEK